MKYWDWYGLSWQTWKKYYSINIEQWFCSSSYYASINSTNTIKFFFLRTTIKKSIGVNRVIDLFRTNVNCVQSEKCKFSTIEWFSPMTCVCVSVDVSTYLENARDNKIYVHCVHKPSPRIKHWSFSVLN